MNTFQVANIALINSENKILLLQRSQNLSNPGKWGLPGGLVDNNEEYEVSATRELYEETGITKDKLEIINYKKFDIKDSDEQIEITVFKATLLQPVSIFLDSYEHTNYKRIEINQIQLQKTYWQD